jgi:integrase
LRVEYKPRRITRREGPLSPKTIRNVYATLSAFFKWACAEFNLLNPMEKVPAFALEQFALAHIFSRDPERTPMQCDASPNAGLARVNVKP